MTTTIYRILTVFMLCSVVLFFTGNPGARAETYYLDITGAKMNKTKVAIPQFSDISAPDAISDKGADMAQLLGKAIEFHGFAEIVDPRVYGGGVNADWKNLGVEWVIMGRFQAAANGVIIEGRLFNVAKNDFLAGQRFTGSLRQQNQMVLQLCDAFIEQLTGEPGISRTKVTFVSDQSGYKEAYIADVLGLSIRQVTRHRNLVVSPRLSRDGNLLCYSSYHAGNQNLYMTDLRQDKVTRAISRHSGMNMAPAWSPDNQSLVATLSKDGTPDLYLLNRQGKIVKRLTARVGINVSASWSPDGSSIVFVSDRSGEPQLYIMNMATMQTRRLTFSGTENTEPSWSPKGDLIVYTGRTDGHYQLFTIDPAGNNGQQLAALGGNCESPSWSPDGKQIVFSQQAGSRHKLCAILKNGTGMRDLLHVKGNQSYPQWASRAVN